MTLKTDDSVVHRPAVSVVIPVYNASEYIAVSVSSVLAQTFSDYELIVVNDGSEDSVELEKALAPFRNRIRYLQQENRGVSSARNAALDVAQGVFYAQLDADDAWKPNYLESQLQFLEQNPGVDLVYPNAEVFTDDSESCLEFMELCPSAGPATFENLVRQKCIVMTSVTARMDAIRKTGRFDESLVSCEDFDFWLRFAKFGGQIGYHREKLVRYRRRSNSLSSDRGRMIANLLRVFAKATTFALTPSERIALAEETDRMKASLNVIEGKRALADKNVDKAIEHFAAANSHLHSRKLTLVVWALRHSPLAVRWALNFRRWSWFRNEKTYLAGLD